MTNPTEAALRQAIADLRAVGDDYPGSSCHKWCHERADAAQAALSTPAPDPVGMAELLDNYNEVRDQWRTRPEFYEMDLDNARRELLSAISRLAQVGQSADESAWLIEWHFHGQIHYVGVAAWGDGMPEMSTVHNALRFARKVDAENVVGYLRRQARYKNYDLKINEHVWHTPTTTERAGA